jgi:hypothetical protein
MMNIKDAIMFNEESKTLSIFADIIFGAEALPLFDDAKHLYIGEDVSSLNSLHQFYLYKLESITVHPDNRTYRSVNNCLIDTRYKRLILACNNSVIPDDDSVETIQAFAFKSSEPFRISIPRSIRCIEKPAFTSLIESISVDPQNIYFEVINDCLIDKANKTLLVSFGNGPIPEDKCVRIIGEEAFSGNSDLTSIHIPENIRIIEKSAFRDCENLQYVKFSEGLRSIQANAFCDCRRLHNFVFPDSLEEIEDFSFGSCCLLTEIKIPKNTQYISVGAFDYCCNLQSVTVDPENQYYKSIDNCLVDSVSDYLLWGSCISKIPFGTKSIERGAFAECEDLYKIIIPDSVSVISEHAFADCDNLEHVHIPDTVNQIGYQAFSGCTILKNIELPSNISRIESCAFEHCYGLERIEIPGNVKSIEEDAFLFCDSLKRVNITEGVESIGEGAFAYCDALEIMYIPESVKYIHPKAFRETECATFVVKSGSYAEHYVKELITAYPENCYTIRIK